MDSLPPFLRHLLLNLRITLLILVAGLGAIVLYALVTKHDASWDILVFLAIGMSASSLLNAWRDTKKKK